MAPPNRLQSLPKVPRRLITALFGATFVVCIFGLVPSDLADLNDELGWWRWQGAVGQALGVALFVASLGLILYCSRLFDRLGHGTPVPINPPTELVISGLYRYSRNPMYVGQVGILLSYFLYSGKLTLLLYACAWAALVQLFIVQVEEPGLRRRFGSSYEDYCRAVPRWLGPRRAGMREA